MPGRVVGGWGGRTICYWQLLLTTGLIRDQNTNVSHCLLRIDRPPGDVDAGAGDAPL